MELFMSVMTVLNTITMALEHASQSGQMSIVLGFTEVVYVGIFSVELMLQFYAAPSRLKALC